MSASFAEEGTLLDYRVRFEFETLAVPSAEPDEYVVDVTGAILYDPEEGPAVEVGQIKAQLIQGGRAINDGYPLDDVFDVSDDTFRLYLALFNKRTRQLKARLQSEFEVYGADILYLCAIEIEAAHRGSGLGLAVVSRAIDVLARDTGSLVVCKPYPLQHDSAHIDDLEWRNRIGAASFAKTQAVGTDKLRSYWGRLGFKMIRGTSYAALSTTFRRPSLAEAFEGLDR